MPLLDHVACHFAGLNLILYHLDPVLSHPDTGLDHPDHQLPHLVLVEEHTVDGVSAAIVWRTIIPPLPRGVRGGTSGKTPPFSAG
jgi:hypothetical protein